MFFYRVIVKMMLKPNSIYQLYKSEIERSIEKVLRTVIFERHTIGFTKF